MLTVNSRRALDKNALKIHNRFFTISLLTRDNSVTGHANIKKYTIKALIDTSLKDNLKLMCIFRTIEIE